MAEIDPDYLITLVQARPVLWDKFLDIYKDRNATKNAWREVCNKLNPKFEQLDDKTKNSFGKEVVRRWGNLRDSFGKYKKRDRNEKKSGSAAKPVKKYVFYDQLIFLDKLYDKRGTVGSMDTPTDGLVENSEHQPQAEAEMLDVPHAVVPPRSDIPKSRKHKKPDEIDLRILKAKEVKKPCNKVSFLHSLETHITKFDNHEFLKFQMGVLKVIESINEEKKNKQPYPHPHFVHSQQQQQQSHPLFIQPSTSSHTPSHAIPYPFYPQQLHTSAHTSSFFPQNPNANQAPITRQHLLNRTPEQVPHQQTDFEGTMETPTRKRRFQELSDLTSTELEQNYSQSVLSPASSLADSIDFATSL